MDMKMIPNVGFGEIRFGMSSQEIELKLSCDKERIIKGYEIQELTDYYEKLGLFIYFDDEEKCAAIEFTTDFQPIYDNCKFIGISAKEAILFLEKKTDDLEIDETGVVSYKLGIGIYADGIDEEPSAPVETIIIFKEGYYD